MKKLFLTSWIGGYERGDENRTPTKLNNTNHFVDRLRLACKDIKVVTYIASDPSNFAKSDEHSYRVMDNLRLEGFDPKELYIIDNRTDFDIESVILKSDVIFLAGGHVPTQNAFFKRIGLKEKLLDFQGVVIGQSAGSMNCAEIVYVQRETPEDFADPNFQIQISGLGLTKYNLMPHINVAHENQYDGVSVYDMCVEDSKKVYHYGIVDGGFIEQDNNGAYAYGETYLFREGKCKKICDNGKNIEINIFYEHCNDMIGNMEL